MSGRNNGGGGGGIGVQSIPSASRKMVQSLKEIVNCSDSEIYVVLKECNMDPNEAVSRLLSQGCLINYSNCDFWCYIYKFHPLSSLL